MMEGLKIHLEKGGVTDPIGVRVSTFLCSRYPFPSTFYRGVYIPSEFCAHEMHLYTNDTDGPQCII